MTNGNSKYYKPHTFTNCGWCGNEIYNLKIQNGKKETTMSRTITKQITESTIRTAVVGIDKKGNPTLTELPVQIVVGRVTRNQIEKQLKKSDTPNAILLDIEETTKTYTMDISEFVKYAREKVE